MIKPIHIKFLIFCLTTGLFFSQQTHAQQIIINEVMASNSEFYSDEDGSFEDWIELYNHGDQAINLEGFGLSDDYGNPFKWVFPSYNLQAGEYLLVWASGKDRIPADADWYNGIKRRFYPNIAGTSVESLVNHPSFPDHPSTRNIIINSFEAPTNIDDNYGQHLFAWIVAPQTGNYVFDIASDDNSHLYLSTDSGEENAVLIAQVPGWTHPREWNKYPEQTSEAIFLQEGEKYYVSALMKEGYGGDNLAVRWHWPDGSTEEPLNVEHCLLPNPKMHTNFRISSAGEELILTNPEGILLDEMPPTHIPTNISYGRVPGNTSDWFYFNTPTPGQTNHSQAYNCISQTPIISPTSGVYAAQPTIQITSDNPEAQILYTIDGTKPSQNNGIIYQGPFTLQNSTYVRAIAIEEACLPGIPAAATYTEPNQDFAGFSSNLPIMIIQSFSQEVSPGDRTHAYMMLKEPYENGRVNWADPNAFNGRIKINIRGSSSQMFPKKNYGFHILDENDDNLKVSLLGMPEEHNWVLHGPYSDKSLMRNAVSYSIAEDAGHYTPRTQFIELFLQENSGSMNTSQYRGVYVLTERIKFAEGRVALDAPESFHNEYPEVSGAYIFAIDRLNEGETGFYTQRNTHFKNVRPNENDISPAQRNYLIAYIDSLETALFGSNFTDPDLGYRRFMDHRSFIDMHLITELTKEIDGYRLSTFFTKDREGKIKSGPLWDFNLSLGNADYATGWDPIGWYYSTLNQQLYMYGWYTRLFQDSWFDQQYKRRYRSLRLNAFSEIHLTGKIQTSSELLQEAQQRNFQRWDILGSHIWPNWFIADSFDEEIEWMTQWLRQRIAWMDSQLGEPLTMLHYWNFNDEINPLEPSYSISQAHLGISLEENAEITTGSGQDFSALNARNGDHAETHLRVNNPIGSSLIFNIPSEGYQDLIFSYETRRSGNGANLQFVSYTIDGEHFIPMDTLNITDKPVLKSIDFIDIPDANNNPLFAVKITFGLNPEADGGLLGNNRFDNVSLDGEALNETIRPPLQISLLPEHLELIENAETYTLDLDNYFRHPDAATLSYAANIENPELAEISISNNQLAIAPQKRGGGKISFEINDGVNPPLHRSFYVLVYPEAVALSQKSFTFDYWSPNEPEGSFPENMIFLQGDTDDATLATPLLYAYSIPANDYATDDQNNIGFPYRNQSRTRINGRESNGISFINTGRGRDLGSALLALDTRNTESFNLSWKASTLLSNSRAYAIRLQYRTSLNTYWKDIKDAEDLPIEYMRTSAPGQSHTFENIQLPVDAMNQAYVQVRWLYYYTGNQTNPNSGARDMLAINHITLGDILTNSNIVEKSNIPLRAYPNPVSGNQVNFNKPITGTLYDLQGRKVLRVRETQFLKTQGLSPGMYFIQTIEGEVAKFII